MSERYVKWAAINYFEVIADPNDPESDEKKRRMIRIERTGLRGTLVKLDRAEERKYDEQGALYPAGYDPDVAVVDEAEAQGIALDPGAATVAELAAWITSDQPTIQQVILMVGDDIELAKKMIAAENEATGNQPRAGLVEGMTKLIQDANK